MCTPLTSLQVFWGIFDLLEVYADVFDNTTTANSGAFRRLLVAV